MCERNEEQNYKDYHLSPNTLAKPDNNDSWQGCGEIGRLIFKMVQQLQE